MLEGRAWVIYTLHDPREPDVIRYAGKTHQKTHLRLKHHLGDARGTSNKTHCTRWVRTLLAAGVKPVMVVVEEGVGDGWEDAERRWIASYRAQGMPLTNITDGGEGTSGWTVPVEDRARRRANMQRLWDTDHEMMCTAIREALSDPETRERFRAAAFQRQSDPSVQAKQTEAQKRSWDNPEIRARRIAGIIEVQANPILRAEHSCRTKAMWADPQLKAQRRAALKAGWARKRANETVQPKGEPSGPGR